MKSTNTHAIRHQAASPTGPGWLSKYIAAGILTMLVLTVFLGGQLQAPTAAEAQTTNADGSETIWETTLTTGTRSVTSGLLVLEETGFSQLSSFGSIDDNDFSYSGSDRTTTGIHTILQTVAGDVNSDVLTWTLVSTLATSDSTKLALELDGTKFLLSEATRTNTAYTWSDHGISWADNQSVAVKLIELQAPSAPTNFEALGDAGLITLRWTPPSKSGGSDITGYKIELSTDGGDNWTVLHTGTVVSRTHLATYNDTGLTTSCSLRTYRVSAINAIGTGPVSDTDSAAPRNGPPGPAVVPSGHTEIWSSTLTVGSGGGNVGFTGSTYGSLSSNTFQYAGATQTIHLITSSETLFQFQLDGNSNLKQIPNPTLHVGSETFAFTEGNEAGTTGVFWNPPLAPSWCPGDMITVKLTTDAPSAPRNLSAKAASPTQIDLEWDAPINSGATAIAGYKIEVSTDSASTWSDLVADTSSTSTTYSHTGLSSGNTRHYRVSGINSTTTGLVSNTAWTTIAAPSAPRNLRATAGDRQITVTWNPPSDDRVNSIQKYQSRYKAVNFTSWADVPDGAAARTKTFTQLNNDIEYTLEIRAVNPVGTGSSASVKSTPFTPTKAITYSMYTTNYSITRGGNVGGDSVAAVFLNANAAVETDTTFTLTWNGRPTDELHPNNPNQLTINAGGSGAIARLRAAADADNPKVYNQAVKANIVAKLGSLSLSDQLIVFDDEWLPTASFSLPETVAEGATFQISAALSHRLDVETYVIGTVTNDSKMSLQGFKQPYIYIYIPAGDLTGQSSHISKPDDNEQDGYGILHVSVNNSDLIHWWPEEVTHTIRVTDDDTNNPALRRYHGEPRIFSGDGSATESGDPNTVVKMPFTVAMYPTSRSTVTVQYRTADGSAKAGTHYRSTSGTLTFAPREGYKTIYVDILDDGVGHRPSFRLFLENPSNPYIQTPSTPYTGRIHDDTPTFGSYDESARESGNGNDTEMNFYVSLQHNDENASYTIDYSTADGTARAGTDYTAVSGTLTFAPGDHLTQVTVPILDDAIEDSGETFSFILSNPTGGAQLHAWRANVKGTILNQDAPGVSASFPTSNFASSSHSGTDDRPKVVVAFSESVATFDKNTPSVKVANATVSSVEPHTEDGIANAYIFTLDPDGDGGITFALLTNAECDSGGICTSAGIKLIESPTMLAITGPAAPQVISQLSVSDATASEEDDSTTDFIVTLNPESDESVTVDYATSDGSATAGGDYTAKNGTLTFAVGETNKTLRVSIIDDDLHETDETFTLTLSNPTGAEINDATATGTITNSDQPELTGRFAGMPDTHDGSTDISFRIEFSENVLTSRGDFRDFAFTVNNGQVTDAQRVDHRSDLWTFAIEPDSNDDVHITLLGNRDCDALGSVCTPDDIPRQLANTLSATVAGPDQEASSDTAEVTTEEATEAASQLSVANATASEENDSTIDFVVTLNPASDGSVTVNYATANVTATAGDDYTAKSGTLTLNAGQTSKTIQVSIIDDAIEDDNETLTLTLSSPSKAEISDATATGTITNNEPAQDPPAEDPPAEDPVVLLTAAFVNVPADHNGENFTFELTFSENVDAGYARIRDHAFTVDGATIAKASRQTPGSNQGWNVEVDPTGNDEVTITLPATTDCDDSGAICTDDERMLSHSTSARVAGPPAISVSDASVQEAEGAVLAFSVTLSNASSRTVVVSYATADGTATAGSDYTAASGSLTFNAGDTSQTVEVPVLTDSDDEGQETLTLTLSNPNQATLGDATGTGTILNGESTGTQDDPPAEDPVVDDPPAEDPVVLVTATFSNMPATHDGTSFTFDLSFSENVKAGYARIRDHAFTVSGGDIISAVRKAQGSNQGWTITVNPDGAAGITITLPETTDCNAARAICTDDGRMLSGPTSETITRAQ